MVTPREPSETEQKYQQQREDWEEKKLKEEKQRKAKNQKYWNQFKDKVLQNPDLLSSKQTRYKNLKYLVAWLSKANNFGIHAGVYSSEPLAAAFSEEIQNQFPIALAAHWRATKPQRQERDHKGRTTYLYKHQDAATAVAYEFTHDKAGLLGCANPDYVRALQHLIYSDQTEIAIDLVGSRENVGIPVLQEELEREWVGENGFSTHHLSNLAHAKIELPERVLKHLLALFLEKPPYDDQRLQLATIILAAHPTKIFPDEAVLNELQVKFESYDKAEDPNLTYVLALMFSADFAVGYEALKLAGEQKNVAAQKQFIERNIGALFGTRSEGLAIAALQHASSRQLYELAIFTHQKIALEDDVTHEGVYTPGVRDQAEDGRGAILYALQEMKNIEAHSLLLRFADEFPKHRHWLRQRSRKMLERDSEQEAWSEAEFNTFAATQNQPVKYGADLQRAVLNTLENLRLDWINEDGSPRQLVMKYIGDGKQRDEKSLQEISLEGLRLRSRGQFHVSREPIVANEKEPDLLVSGINAPYEVAIEIKQADKWSFKQLTKALSSQLVEQYLLPSNRKNGVLLLINTKTSRIWTMPDTRKKVSFDEILVRLQEQAQTLRLNNSFEDVRVFGIDLTNT